MSLPGNVEPPRQTTGELKLVGLMVVCGVLSAASAYQAAQLAEAAAERASEARFMEALTTQADAGIQTTIAYDRRLWRACDEARRDRDAAIASYVKERNEDQLRRLVEHEQTRVALEPLFVAGECEQTYDARFTLESGRLDLQQLPIDDAEPLRGESDVLAGSERIGLIAIVAFAAGVLFLQLVESSSGRWRTIWWRLAVLTMVAGLILFAAATAGSQAVVWLPPDAPPLGLLVLVTIIGVLAAALGGLSSASLKSRRRRLRRRVALLAARGPLRALANRSAPWWSEFLGAVTLVSLAIAVLGIATMTIRGDSDASAADRFTSQSGVVSAIGRESTLATLEYVSTRARDLAKIAADTQGIGEDRGTAHRDQEWVASPSYQHWRGEAATWDSLLELQKDAGGGETCIRSELTLPWSAATVSHLPDTLLREYREDDRVIADFVRLGSRGAAACSVEAAISRDTAGSWDARASVLTVAVLVLGLGAFFFGLAGDPDRTETPRRWLLTSGIAGLVVGMSATGVGWLSPDAHPDAGTRARAASSYAEAAYAISVGDCGVAAGRAAELVDELPEFSLGHFLVAQALACRPESDWLLGPVSDSHSLHEIHHHLQAANQRNEGSSDRMTRTLARARLLSAVSDAPPSAPAIRASARAIDAIWEGDKSDPFLCFDRALASLALGADDATDRYASTLSALGEAGAGPCSGFPSLESRVRLSALADLEFAATYGVDADTIETLRSKVVGAGDAVRISKGPCPADMTLEVFPQEVGLYTEEGSRTAVNVVIIWYYRHSPAEPWLVMLDPSLKTMSVGGHLDTLFAIRRVAPSGHYRADVYCDGALHERVLGTGDWREGYGVPMVDFKRVEAVDLGISAVVPEDWEVLAAAAGVEVVYGPCNLRVRRDVGEAQDECVGEQSTPGILALRREDGSSRVDPLTGETTDDALPLWSERVLDRWRAPLTHPWVMEDGNAWFLSFLTNEITVETIPHGWRGSGDRPYAPAAPSDSTCPGTTVMSLVDADDIGLGSTIWYSQVREVDLPRVILPPAKGARSGVEEFTVVPPKGWDVVVCPGLLRAAPTAASADEFSVSAVSGTDFDEFKAAEISRYARPECIPSDPLPDTILPDRVEFSCDFDTGPLLYRDEYLDGEGIHYRITLIARKVAEADGLADLDRLWEAFVRSFKAGPAP